jgi:hypothetical protein
MSHRLGPIVRATLRSAVVVPIVITVGLAMTAPAAVAANPNATTIAGQTSSGSNGVNHNDTPPPANPNCTNSPGTSGTCSQHQPASNADFSGSGANTSGNYNSTRNGAPSDNGNGNGQATGKPCAGCVGKADNKNPQGQAPSGPIDHNNGYECDGNNGIGQTNPAHTGCTGQTASGVTSPPPSPCTSGSTGGSSMNQPCTSSSVCAPSPTGGPSESMCTPAAISGSPTAEVLGEQLTAPRAIPSAAVLGEQLTAPAQASVLGEQLTRGPTGAAQASTAARALPFTGMNTTAAALLGLGVCALGVTALFLGRRRRIALAP